MRSLRNTLKTRGIIPTLARGMRMLRRYGFSERKMRIALTQMSIDSKNHGIGITIPVTAEILTDERAEFLKGLMHENFEVTVHGYRHLDYSTLSNEALEDDISQAKRIFKERDIDPKGYRAPYLRSRVDLLELLARHGFQYSSSKTLIFDEKKFRQHKLIGLSNQISTSIYEPKSMNNWMELNETFDRVVEIPVSLPDDEILLDRLNISDVDILQEILEEIIRASFNLNPFVVLQIHPERYLIFRNAMLSAIETIRKEFQVTPATLKELSSCLISNISSNRLKNDNPERFICVSGDLDIISIGDLWR